MVTRTREELYEMFDKNFIDSLDANSYEMYRLFANNFVNNYKRKHNITSMMASSSIKNKKPQKRPGKIQKTVKLPKNVNLENLLRQMTLK